MEVFASEDVTKIVWKKLVVVIGDSIQRCVYKDLVCLLVPESKTRYLTTKELKAKGEVGFLNDKLLQGGQLGDVKTGVNYREVRQFDSGTTIVKFYFVTRCYSDHVESVLNELKTMQPHVIIMNSCLWDLHRYGPRGPDSYSSNMDKLMVGLKKAIPNDAVFIWNATLPLDSKCKGGFLLPYFENIPSQEIMEANFVASNIVLSHGFVFLDLHSIFVNQLHHRANDGIHWNHLAHRRISNLILFQLCRTWNMPVPRKMAPDLLREPALLHPLNERPHSASFSSYTSHLNIDRYGFSSTSDARYVVQKTVSESRNSYRDRFRLIGSPINNFTSSIGVNMTNHKPSPLSVNLSSNVKNENGGLLKPIYSSSPLETNPKTKSFLKQSDGTTSPALLTTVDATGIPVSEGHLRQMLMLSQHLNQARKHSCLDERGNYQSVVENGNSQVGKISTPYISNVIGTRSCKGRKNGPVDIKRDTTLSSTVSQSSSLVIQVTSSPSTETSSSFHYTTCTSVNNPASSTESQVSQLSIPVSQVRSSQVSKTTHLSIPVSQVRSSQVSKTTHLSIPVSQVTSSQVTKTTHCMDEKNTNCTSVNKVVPRHVSQLSKPVSQVTSSQVTKTTHCVDKECTTCSSSSMNVTNKEKIDTTKSPSENVAPTTNQLCKVLNGSGTRQMAMVSAHQCTSNMNTHVIKQTNEKEKYSTERRPSKDLKRKASVGVEHRIPTKRCNSSTSSNSHSEAELSGKNVNQDKSKEKITSIKSSEKEAFSRGQKRRATGDVEPSRHSKHCKLPDVSEKTCITTENSSKSSNELKRKFPVEATSNVNTKQQHRELDPPAKRVKSDYETSGTQNASRHSMYHTQRNGSSSVSRHHSTSSSGSRTTIPVHSGTPIETLELSTQRQCNPSYNCYSQGSAPDCYWTQGQRSLQDIQQQQLWFNTLLSQGRISAWRNMNNVQPSINYNPYTRSWQMNQGYYYNNNNRY